ncbi:hypothetical protein Taro_046000 [Colocasia esculenta]|uniref:Phosphate transporter PHO1 n=1 Tax=Colocasia esculenta TaxID=4460 RepID=A0A843X507_COLES|nr:hypothetical protein [Colocasia esculenta]
MRNAAIYITPGASPRLPPPRLLPGQAPPSSSLRLRVLWSPSFLLPPIQDEPPPRERVGPRRRRAAGRERGVKRGRAGVAPRMVKFSRELEAQLIPEWKDAFVDYRQLKKHVKKIKLSLSRTQLSDGRDHVHGHGHHRRPEELFGFSILDPFRHLAGLIACRGASDHHHHNHGPGQGDEEEQYQMELVQSGEDEVREFFDRLGEELDKVNNFYRAKEAEFVERGDLLNKQLQILLDLKHILNEHRRRRRLLASSAGEAGLDSPSVRSSDSGVLSRLNSNISESATEADESPMADTSVTDDLMAALERNGITFVPSGRGAKAKKGGKPKAASMRIDIPATTPTRTISALTSMIWEDLVNNPKKEGGGGGGGDYINRKKIQCAEKMIRGAFVELYRGLGLLKTYSSLNMLAFTKILKKFDKVAKQQASASYLKVVKRSHFVSSDKIVRLGDEVESIFTQHFANGDRKKAMKFLRPHEPKDSHMITFFVGLFTGSFVTLFCVYAILAHLTGIFSSSNSPEPDYVETVYPVFSTFALISLHIFLYGCNLLAWRSTRINYNFIFEFSPKTALKHRDAFLICTSIMTMVVGALVVQLIMLKSGVFLPHQANAIPGILLLLCTGMLICPFNIFYRSTRYSFLRVIRNIVFSPFYKVLMVDFFMADQLTSQIPLLRHMEFTVCYFMAGGFKTSPFDTCTRSQQYKLLAYVISFLPYYWRAMQCIRRYVEEGYDLNHMANAGKYVSAMIAAAARMKYAVDPTPLWLAVVVITSTMATCYQLYWDYVKDWGFFTPGSGNLWLRDELVLKNKSVYYVSIATNFVLRLAWVETVMKLNLGRVEHRMVDFLLASLEVIRRGHWNYYRGLQLPSTCDPLNTYKHGSVFLLPHPPSPARTHRLENEHLNNAGKFRAVKTVPLPFREMESD